MLCHINLFYSILNCTYTKATISEQNIFLQDLANIGLCMLGYVVCLNFLWWFMVYDIHKITPCTCDRTVNIHK